MPGQRGLINRTTYTVGMAYSRRTKWIISVKKYGINTNFSQFEEVKYQMKDEYAKLLGQNIQNKRVKQRAWAMH